MGKLNIYIVTGTQWSSVAAETSERAAKARAKQFRERDGAANIEVEQYASLDAFVAAKTTMGCVACTERVPAKVCDLMDDRYGKPKISGGGEVAYWDVK